MKSKLKQINTKIPKQSKRKSNPRFELREMQVKLKETRVIYQLMFEGIWIRIGFDYCLTFAISHQIVV